ncbi:MAG: IgGFc-binding protein [Byssovorax sp.]
MKLGLFPLALVSLGLAAAGFVACSATPGSGTFQTGAGGLGGSANATSATDSTGSGGAGGAIFTTGNGTGVGGGCATHCSSDLHAVLDCNGGTVSTCPPDQGCGPNGCVPACESAKSNKGSIGCDYYSVDPDIISAAAGSCFAAYIANTWTSPVSITVDRAGQSLDVSSFARIPSGAGQAITYSTLPGGKLPPGQVAILFLARSGDVLVSCPPGITPAFTTSDAAVHGTGMGSAFHIATSAPVVAYDIFPYGGGQSAATSATLLLPTTVWDTNYIAVDAFRKSQIAPEAQPSIDIVAAEDGTTVTISPTAGINPGNGVAGTSAGVPHTYNLDRGQVLQFTQDAELIGSPIQSNKPIGLWGAATCLNIDVTEFACDSAHQQIPPIKALGHEYVAVRYRNRFDGQEESPPWRLVGAVAGTNLIYEPAPPQGAPPTLTQGQVAEFRAPGPFTVKSQDGDHPFYMSAHMTGCQEVNPDASDCRGDPEFVNVIPAQQYLSSYVFFTDPTYPETNLVLVRNKTASGFKDVKLDCAGVITGWQPAGTSGSYEYARIDLVRHNFVSQNGCDNGRHEIHSDAPFGLTVWGWGTAESGGSAFGGGGPGFFSQAVSYAYPAGASVQAINQVVIVPIPK